jgi:hypothetical protein
MILRQDDAAAAASEPAASLVEIRAGSKRCEDQMAAEEVPPLGCDLAG